MSRSAILIGNSVVAQHTQLRLGAPLIKRTLSQFAAVLKDLPGEYAFTVTECADLPPAKLRRVLDRAAEKSARQDEILLVYYFGHGRLLNNDRELSGAVRKSETVTLG